MQKIWKPTDKQSQMLRSNADLILFGGSRGGGKTEAAIRWFLYNINNPLLRGLVIRKNAKDLYDFTDRAYRVYSQFGAKKTGSPVKFTFPGGATIYTGHLATEDAYTAYQGHEYQMMLIEELTHIPTVELFEKLLSSLRSTVPDLHPQFLATANPGGAGHYWVRDYWKILEKPNGIKFKENGITKIFIPANIHDNKYLEQADPKYVQFLQNLPLDLRKKWYEGSWEDIDTDNQYYAKLLTQGKARITNIPIEPSLRTFSALDLGVNDNMVLWTAQLFGKEIRIIDCYANRNQPLKHYTDYLYDMRDKTGVRVETLFVPHDANVRSMTSDSLQTRYQKLQELGFNVEFVPNISRADGIEKVRELLGYCYFDRQRCESGLKALRNYKREFDTKMNRYKDTPLHDWSSDYADSFRYLALGLGKIKSQSISNIGAIQKNLWRRR